MISEFYYLYFDVWFSLDVKSGLSIGGALKMYNISGLS